MAHARQNRSSGDKTFKVCTYALVKRDGYSYEETLLEHLRGNVCPRKTVPLKTELPREHQKALQWHFENKMRPNWLARVKHYHDNNTVRLSSELLGDYNKYLENGNVRTARSDNNSYRPIYPAGWRPGDDQPLEERPRSRSPSKLGRRSTNYRR